MYFKLRKTHFKRSPFWIGHSNQIESKSEFIFKLCQQIDAKAGAAFVTVRDLVGETHILLLLFAQQRTSRKYNFFCLDPWSWSWSWSFFFFFFFFPCLSIINYHGFKFGLCANCFRLMHKAGLCIYKRARWGCQHE